MSPRLSSYTDPDEIRARLAVLHEKAWRIGAYNATCAPGMVPETGLLDEKQQTILAHRHREGRRFPWDVRKTLGRTIQVLQDRLDEIEQQVAA